MLWILVVSLAVACSAEYSVKCSNSSKSSVTVVAADDGTAGRYIVEYCTAVDRTVTKWELVMSTLKQAQQNCSYEILAERFSGVAHSHSEELVDLGHLNCSRACFSKPMDLMFRSCYRLDNKLYRGMRSSEPFNTYYFVDNNITGYTRDKTLQFVTDIDYDTMVSFHWFEGHIPLKEYEITVWPNDTHREETTNVTGNCSRADGAVRCSLRLAAGCYMLQLKHRAPWTKGLSHLQVYETVFCHTGSVGPELAAGVSRWWWAGGLALLLLAAAGAALAARLAARAKRDLRRLVRDSWLTRASEPEKPTAAVETGAILLLYARDCPAATRVARALCQLLQEVAPGQVYDIYSPAVTALAARSPAAWTRGALLSAGARAVLLQTPALAATHPPACPDTEHHKLEEPLLRRRAVYRAPAFGDTLLQYALQLLAETAHAQPHPPYKKYFLATISELPVDLFPTIVPYTRYELPAASAALAHALCPTASASETTLAELALASNELVQYATKENPHYLSDLLVFL